MTRDWVRLQQLRKKKLSDTKLRGDFFLLKPIISQMDRVNTLADKISHSVDRIEWMDGDYEAKSLHHHMNNERISFNPMRRDEKSCSHIRTNIKEEEFFFAFQAKTSLRHSFF